METASSSPNEPSTWELLRDLYLSFDRRTLGLTRILLGFFLLFDLFRRTPDWLWMFSDEGVLPASHNLFRPQSSGWSLFNAFHTPGELWALWAIGFVTFAMLLVGYKTRAVQVLAAIYVASANGRVLLIENGGYVVQNLLLLWTAFLPLGDRFSVDAWIRSWRQAREQSAAELNDRASLLPARLQRPHVSLLGAALVLQLGALYFFNVVHKTGPAWANGTAVHYVLYNDRMATPLIAAVRDHLPNAAILFLSKLTMVLEAAIPICLLSPLARVWSRRFVVAAIVMLHVGFGSSFVLGPFAWSLCVFASLFINKEDWDLLGRVMRRTHRAVVLRYAPSCDAAFWLCRVIRRLDGLELVRFEASEDIAAWEVRRGERREQGAAALARLVEALPLGPLVALVLKRRVVVRLVDGLWRLIGPQWLRVTGLSGTKRQLQRESSTEESGAEELNVPASSIKASDAEESSATPTSAKASSIKTANAEAPEMGISAYEASPDFVACWLERPGVGRAVGLLMGGSLVAIYGGPLLDRLQTRLSRSTLGGVQLGDALLWLGLALGAVGLVLVLRSLLQTAMVLNGEGVPRPLRLPVLFREALIVVMLGAAVNQALVELWVARPLKFPQPPVMQALAHKLRYLQGWFMFSPNPVMDDGIIVVDAVTVDGRHVDPFSIHYGKKTLRAPNFDLLHAQSLEYNQIWSDYFNRMHYPQNKPHQKPMEQFIYRLPKRTGNPNDAIVSGEVYWVHDMNPKWNSTNSYDIKKKKIFSFTNPGISASRRAAAHQKSTAVSKSPNDAATDSSARPGPHQHSRQILRKSIFRRATGER